MKQPLYATLRAVGLGATCGTPAAIPLAVAAYLGLAALIGLAVLAGPGLIAVSHVLERRARRASNGDETK
jgi:hypothetical protein